MATCPGCHLDAGDSGHAPVQDGDVVVIELQLVDRAVAPIDGIDQVAGVLEALNQHLAESLVIFGDEDAHASGRLAAEVDGELPVALSWTRTNPPMQGGAMPHSRKG